MNRAPLLASFVLFLALCVSAAYWGMQLFNPPLRAVAAPPQSNQAAASLDAAAGLFGGHANAVLASNFQLKGVVVSSNPAESVAILAANGKAAQAVRTNKEVLPGVVVKEGAEARGFVSIGHFDDAGGAGLPKICDGDFFVCLLTVVVD